MSKKLLKKPASLDGEKTYAFVSFGQLEDLTLAPRRRRPTTDVAP